MRLVNRCIVTVRVKQPYVDWANSFDDGGPTITLEETRSDCNVYLFKDFEDMDKAVKYIERNHAYIFESELWDWMQKPDVWPQNRNLRMFRKWFDLEIHLTILDIENGPISAE